jgi:hypothetical protein
VCSCARCAHDGAAVSDLSQDFKAIVELVKKCFGIANGELCNVLQAFVSCLLGCLVSYRPLGKPRPDAAPPLLEVAKPVLYQCTVYTLIQRQQRPPRGALGLAAEPRGSRTRARAKTPGRARTAGRGDRSDRAPRCCGAGLPARRRGARALLASRSRTSRAGDGTRRATQAGRSAAGAPNAPSRRRGARFLADRRQ